MIKQVRAAATYLAAIEIWPVIFFTSISVISARALPIAVGVAGLFWIIRWLAYGRVSIRTPVDWAMALLALMLPVTLWVTTLPEVTRPQVYRLLSGVALYYAIVNWATSHARLRLISWGLIAAGLMLALIAPSSVQWLRSGKVPLIPESTYALFTTLMSDTVNPNVMAGALVILLPCILALLQFGWEQFSVIKRVFIGIVVLVMTAVLLLTQSRGALVALVAALMVMVALRWRRGWLVVSAVVIFGVVAAQVRGFGSVLNAITTNKTFGGADARLEIWSRALFMIHDFAFTGIGMGSFKHVTDALYPFSPPLPDIPHAHNLFLQVAVDLGLPGLIAWLAVLALTTIAAWQVYRCGRVAGDSWVCGLGAGLLGSQVALVAHGLMDAALWGMIRPAVLVWGLWGLAMASRNVYLPLVERRQELEALQGSADMSLADLAPPVGARPVHR
jgi:putative inorganic carbon (HCO3(-)) transporter